MKTKLSFALATAALLAACGGGGSSTADNSDATSTASVKTAELVGATTINTGSSTQTGYDLTADIGDTWRIIFDSATNTYSVKVGNSQFGITDTSSGSSGTFTSQISGNLTTYTLNGGVGSLVVDKRTKGITGNMTVDGKSTTVTGTGYVVSDLSKLAGTYNFMSATRNHSNGGYPEFLAGQIKINSTGDTAIVCVAAKVNSTDGCEAIETALPTERQTLTIRIDKNTIIPTIRMELPATATAATAAIDFGILNVHAGDLGTALIIDRFGRNSDGILRVGSFYAVKAPTQPLASNVADGTWSCRLTGNNTSTAVISGTKNTIKETANTTNSVETWEETITWNKFENTNSTIDWNGVGSSKYQNDKSSAVMILPISSTFAAVEQENSVAICNKSN